MKKHLKLLTLLILLVSQGITSKAQVPQKMGFQAVIRDAANTLIVNQPIAMRVSILQGSVTGTSVYTETHTTTTNINGLVTLEIGTGSVVSGVFASINWANGPYFIKTETDPNGGSNYAIISTSQLLSVPYAFHARTADSILNPISNNIKYIIKQNNESRANDTTHLDDSELFFDLSPNSSYVFEFFVIGNVSTTETRINNTISPTPSDVKYSINVTGTLSNILYFPSHLIFRDYLTIPNVFIKREPIDLAQLSIPLLEAGRKIEFSGVSPRTICPNCFPFLGIYKTEFVILIKGSLTTGGNASKLSLAWSQKTIRDLPLIVYKGSYGVITKVN